MAKDLKIQLDGGAYNAMESTAAFGAATSGPCFTALPQEKKDLLPVIKRRILNSRQTI